MLILNSSLTEVRIISNCWNLKLIPLNNV